MMIQLKYHIKTLAVVCASIASHFGLSPTTAKTEAEWGTGGDAGEATINCNRNRGAFWAFSTMACAGFISSSAVMTDTGDWVMSFFFLGLLLHSFFCRRLPFIAIRRKGCEHFRQTCELKYLRIRLKNVLSSSRQRLLTWRFFVRHRFTAWSSKSWRRFSIQWKTIHLENERLVFQVSINRRFWLQHFFFLQTTNM